MKYLVTSMFNQASTDAILALVRAEITRAKELAAQGGSAQALHRCRCTDMLLAAMIAIAPTVDELS